MTIARRSIFGLLFLALSLLIAFGLSSIYRLGEAHAQGSGSAVVDVGSGSGSGSAAIAAPDPISHPGETLSMLGKLYHSGAFFALGIVALFCLLYVLDTKIAWFREGKRGAYFAAALGGLALIVGPATQGTTPNIGMIGSAFAAAIALVINPKKS